jgi:hypothetical protein
MIPLPVPLYGGGLIAAYCKFGFIAVALSRNQVRTTSDAVERKASLDWR